MRILSYTISDEQHAVVSTFVKTTCKGDVHMSFQETNVRDGYKQFVSTIQEEDTVVFYSMQDVFQQIEPFIMFLRYCKTKQVRVISISDEIDSKDEVFPLSSSQQWMKILSQMKTGTIHECDDARSELYDKNCDEERLKKHRMVINLYLAGYTVSEILRLTGYRTKATIYRIIQRYGIEIQNPNMRREKMRNCN